MEPLDATETLMVLRDDDPRQGESAVRAVERLGGRVVHRYGPRVLIVDAPASTVSALTRALPLATIGHESLDASELNLDATGTFGLEAFAHRCSETFAEAKAARPFDGEPWDRPGNEPPIGIVERPPDPGQASPGRLMLGPNEPQAHLERLGHIIIVNGPKSDLRIASSRVKKINSETQTGLSWLASRSQRTRGGVSWVHHVTEVTLSVPADKNAPDREAVWFGPTMEKLGYAASWWGLSDYLDEQRRRDGTRWAYAAFFVRYPVSHFAYANIDGGKIVIQDNGYGGWGVDNLDRIFAHETGHIFSAPDEYPDSKCDCDGSWGALDQPNANCKRCAPGGGVKCIMSNNDWQMCDWTQWHLGFYWPPGLHINGHDKTSEAPAAVEFNDKPYVFWKGQKGTGIHFSSSSDGVSWAKSTEMDANETTKSGPATIRSGSLLYVFWKNDDKRDPNKIYFSHSADARSWSGGRAINPVAKTDHAPTAAVFGGYIWVLWTDDKDETMRVATAGEGGFSWTLNQGVSERDHTTSSPAAVKFGDRPYVFWKSREDDGDIRFSSMVLGGAWSDSRPVGTGGETSGGPAAVVYEDVLHLFWRGRDHNQIFHMSTTDAVTWSASERINEDDTNRSPAALVHDGKLYAFCKGEDSDRIFYSALLNDTRA
jgi:hypothetical protein